MNVQSLETLGIRVYMGIFTTALRNKELSQILKKKKKNLTLLPQCIACYLTAYYVLA